MSDATEISRKRSELYLAVAAALVDTPWRVHRTSPAQIAAPCVWLDSVELSLDRETSAAFVVAAFPIYIVVDGTVRRQIEELDDLVAKVWTAAASVGEPQASRPTALDVGGPSLRAQALEVDVVIQAVSLCPLDLVTAGGNP
jgi:hypothetical protein